MQKTAGYSPRKHEPNTKKLKDLRWQMLNVFGIDFQILRVTVCQIFKPGLRGIPSVPGTIRTGTDMNEAGSVGLGRVWFSAGF